jgi:ABC-2 type transport system ATP-binding protein
VRARCRVLHNGKVLAQGKPSEVSKLAAGSRFLADPPAGQKARDLQARLLDDPNCDDAVPEGGQVRFVRAEGCQGPQRSGHGRTRRSI